MSLDGAFARVLARLERLESVAERRSGLEIAGAPISRLNFTAAADTLNGATVTGTAYDLIATQNFTVGSASSLIELVSSGAMIVHETAAAVYADVGFYVDSTTRYYFGSVWILVAGLNHNMSLNGSIWLSGLSAGVHTLRIQVVPIFGAGVFSVYFRAATQPGTEFGRFGVIEHPR